MTEPRSIEFSTDRWLNDSRVYNLIWLGRWLERADTTVRVVNTFARIAVDQGSDMETFQRSLNTAAATRGITVDVTVPEQTLPMLLKDHSASSIYHSIVAVRNNATQVGTVEMLRAVAALLNTLEGDFVMPETPLDALLLTNTMLERLGDVYGVIDDSWFHQEALSEEEVYRRFVQQQQQQQEQQQGQQQRQGQ